MSMPHAMLQIDSVSSVPTKSGWDDNTPFEQIFSSHKRRASVGDDVLDMSRVEHM